MNIYNLLKINILQIGGGKFLSSLLHAAYPIALLCFIVAAGLSVCTNI
jgi:hypothetical protein